LGLSDDIGRALPAEHVRLSHDAVTVPAGGEAAVTVTVDIGAVDPGVYGGWLAARDGEGRTVLHTPVGFYKEAPMYVLTVEGIARDGRAGASWSFAEVVNVDDLRRFSQSAVFSEGRAVFRVPAGRYSISG